MRKMEIKSGRIFTVVAVLGTLAASAYAFIGPPVGCTPESCPKPLDINYALQTVSVSNAPTADAHVANKQYVDNAVAAYTPNNMPSMISPLSGVMSSGWGQAAAYCANLSYGGYTDWRMPDRDELIYMVAGGAGTAITDSQYLWTRTPADNSITGGTHSTFWVVLKPSNGDWYWNNYNNSNSSVRCVR